MREIKFRVFSYEGNEMLDWDRLKETPDLAEFFRHPEECAYYSNLMQYTGLKDKNGREI
ncbi:YopX family protein [Bacillus smithii]